MARCEGCGIMVSDWSGMASRFCQPCNATSQNGRIAKLETVLREMGKLAMEDAMSDKGFRHYVHTEVGFALEESDGK